MDPITIGLGAGAALLLFKGLKGSKPSAAVQATEQGAAEIDFAGNAGVQTATQGQTANQQSNTQGFKVLTGAAGAGAGAGAAAAGASGAAAGALTGAVTFGIGALVGLAAVLWAKHEQRIKGAKSENAGWNLIAPGWSESIQGIFAAYNKGQITDLTAVSEIKDLQQRVLTSASKFDHQPGVDWAGSPRYTGQNYWTNVKKCDKHCTIGCCIWNNFIVPSTNNAIALIQHKPVVDLSNGSPAPLSTIKNPGIPPMTKYGFRGIPGFTLSVAVPRPGPPPTSQP